MRMPRTLAVKVLVAETARQGEALVTHSVGSSSSKDFAAVFCYLQLPQK